MKKEMPHPKGCGILFSELFDFFPGVAQVFQKAVLTVRFRGFAYAAAVGDYLQVPKYPVVLRKLFHKVEFNFYRIRLFGEPQFF